MTSITQINTSDGRFYEIAGVLYPSVTTILQATMPQEQQERLLKWRQKTNATDAESGTSVRDSAASRGTKIHELIAAWLTGNPLDCPDELMEFWNPVRKIIAALSSPMAIESGIYHPTLRYAGTLDLVALWQGRVTIFDWKTSTRVKRLDWMGDAALQVTAYKAAFECLYEIQVEQAVVVVISPNRTQLFEIEVQQYWDAWLKRLEAYHSSSDAS